MSKVISKTVKASAIKTVRTLTEWRNWQMKSALDELLVLRQQRKSADQCLQSSLQQQEKTLMQLRVAHQTSINPASYEAGLTFLTTIETSIEQQRHELAQCVAAEKKAELAVKRKLAQERGLEKYQDKQQQKWHKQIDEAASHVSEDWFLSQRHLATVYQGASDAAVTGEHCVK